MDGMLSPADVAVLSGNTGANNGFGDGNGIWWIIVLIALFGWGRNGNGFGGNNGNDGGNCYYGFGAPNIYGKLDGITYGISDSTFALNNSITNGFAGVQNALCQGFNGLNVAYLQGNNALSSQLANCCCGIERQISDCCCKVERGIDGINYNNAMQTNSIQQALCNSTRDLLENNNNNTRAILDFLTQDKISTLTAENQALKFQASQSAQNAFITANQDAQTAELIRRLGADCPVPAYVVPNPNCCYNYAVVPTNTGCGCNNY